MIDEYISYLRDVRRYSPRTQAIYRDALEDFARFTGDFPAMPEMTGSMVREYEAHLIGRGMKSRTVHLHLSAVSRGR